MGERPRDAKRERERESEIESETEWANVCFGLRGSMVLARVSERVRESIDRKRVGSEQQLRCRDPRRHSLSPDAIRREEHASLCMCVSASARAGVSVCVCEGTAVDVTSGRLRERVSVCVCRHGRVTTGFEERARELYSSSSRSRSGCLRSAWES